MLDIGYFVVTMVLSGGVLYLGRRAVLGLEALVANYARRTELLTSGRVFSPVASPSGQERQTVAAAPVRVPDLPPEVIAPHLRQPPRSTGFGGPVDRSGQSQSDSPEECGPAQSESPTTPKRRS